MGRNKDLFKNTSYVVVGSIGAKIVGFLMLPLYTRWLSPSDYGITDVIDLLVTLCHSRQCQGSQQQNDEYLFHIHLPYNIIKLIHSYDFPASVIVNGLAGPIRHDNNEGSGLKHSQIAALTITD